MSPHCREIQQLLVKIGDKDKSFVGSNKWIGAIEIGYVLDEYLGVTSKVITVNRCGAGGQQSVECGGEAGRGWEGQGGYVGVASKVIHCQEVGREGGPMGCGE